MPMDEGLLTWEEKAVFTLRALFESAGYTRFRVSRFEPYDFYARLGDVLDQRILTFSDVNGRLMALKPDMTLSMLRTAETGSRLYYNESVYRSEDGAFRETLQAGAECIGRVGVREAAGVTALAARALGAVFPGGMLSVSHLGFLLSALRALKMTGDTENEALRLIRARSTDGLTALAAQNGLKKEDGALLKTLAMLCAPIGEAETLLAPLVRNAGMEKGMLALKAVAAAAAQHPDAAPVLLDLTVINPMRYYDGLAFSGFVKGSAQAVLSGGQYGGLMRRLGRKGGGAGFALYLSQKEERP